MFFNRRFFCWFFVFFFFLALQNVVAQDDQNEKKQEDSSTDYLVDGVVFDKDGNGIAKVKIVVRSGVNVVAETTTLEEGDFSFSLSQTGLYTVSFSIAKKKTKTEILSVIKGIKIRPMAVELQDVVRLDIVTASSFAGSKNNEKKTLQVSAFDSKAIEEKNISNVNDLSGASANLYALDTGSSSSLYLALRGITSVGTLDPVVVFYIDGVAQFQSINNPLQLANISSIEVYKGAQGTIFGRNALAGVVDIYTKRSEKRWGGDISAEVDSKLQHSYTANFSFPIYKEMIFGKIGGFASVYDGDFYNSVLDKRVGGHLNGSFYSDLNFYPTPAFELSLLGKYESIDEEAFPYIGGGLTFEENLALAKKHLYNVNYDVENKNIKKTGSFTVKANYKNDYIDLLSVTTYQNLSNELTIDTDFSQSDVGSADLQTQMHLATEEIKVSSRELLSNYCTWLVGSYVYYQNNKSKTDIYVNNSVLTNLDFVRKYLDVRQGNFGVALFGNVDVPLSQKVSMVLGSRVDVDIKNVKGDKNIKKESGKLVKDFDFDEQKIDWFYTPKLAFHFQFVPEYALFMSLTRGFRSGGVNAFVSDKKNLFYNKETSWQSEIGMKLNHGGKRGNFSMFYTYWKDQQVNVFFEGDFFQFGLFNAKKSYAFGAEWELALPLFYGFSVEGTSGFSMSKFLEYVTPDGEVIKNNAQPFVPESTLSVGLSHQYDLKLGPKKVAFAHINRLGYRYVKDIFYDPKNLIRSAGYGLLGFTTIFRVHNVALKVWFENILDERYVAFSLPFGGIIPVRLGDPFTFGAKISVYF